MGTIKIPAGLQDLTPQWLTEALRHGGAIGSASVTGIEKRIIGEGAGFMGQLAQLTLQYDRPEEGAPRSLIAKLPATAPENREVAMFFRFYEREVNFYDQIAERVELRTPRRYHSAFDPATGDYVLLLEDLAPAVVGDQLAGCRVEQARLAIGELAKFHATWWQHPKLPELTWMPSIADDWYIESVEESYADAWKPFTEHFGQHLSRKLRRVAEEFVKHIRAFMLDFGSPPSTIIHGDYRLDNLFFGAPGGDPLAVIDWQISSRGRGIFDVAYFTAGTLPPADRKAKERDLVRMYHDTLVERGVRGYEFDRCWLEYRRSVMFLIVYSVIAMGSIDLANERGVELFTTILKRTLAAIEDLKAYEVLG